MLSIEVITDQREFDRVVSEWAKLDAELSPRTPFSGPLWCQTWWRHLRRSGLRARDEMRVFLVREAGRLIGVAPMMLTLRPSFGPFRTRELQFFGADTYMTELRGPVCRPEDIPRVVAALSDHFRQISSEFDWVQWRGLRMVGLEGESSHPALSMNGYFEQVDYFLELPESWKELHSRLPRNLKESLRKCYNSLARDGHSFTFHVVEDATEIDGAVRRFLDLHRGRSAATDTTQHLDVFAQPPSRRFLFDYTRALAAQGDLRLFQLIIDGRVVATRIGIVLGKELYLYYSGYDLAWKKYSVMTTTVAESIRWSIENKISVVNLSTGTDVSKMRWRPSQVVYAGGYQVKPSARSRLAFSSVDIARRSKNKVGLVTSA